MLPNNSEKQELRQRMLAARDALDPDVVERAGRAAQHLVMQLPQFAAATTVALYAPIRNEVATGGLLDGCLQAGKQVLFPAVTGSSLEFRAVSGLNDLVCGYRGIAEPSAYCNAVALGSVGMIVVPGIAFDRRGRRVGYGKGFYDRALHELERTGRLVGLCYDFQIVDAIPEHPHDVVMDVIVSDKEVLVP